MATKNRTEKGRIVQPGMGGFLNPPTHPEHDWHVQVDLRRQPHNRGGLSLTAATKAGWLDPTTRSEARAMLKSWQPPPLNSPEIIDWRQHVLGYFRNMYRNPNAPEAEQWNASAMIVDRERDPIASADEHAGVHFIRKFYPDYVPTEEDFGGAYWGSRPEGATMHEAGEGSGELVGFSSWPEVLEYARKGGDLYYKAPMDHRATRLIEQDAAPVENTYRVQARTIKIWPRGSIGRGRFRTSDPFTADAGHLDRFSHPAQGHAYDDYHGRVGEAPRNVPADEHAAQELVLYIENTSDLSPDGPSGQGRSVLLNALRKWKKGTYNPELAVKLFGYLVETGAKRYAKEFGNANEWSTMFTPATRQLAAKDLEETFRRQAENGEYDHVDTKIGAREGRVAHEARRGKKADQRAIDFFYEHAGYSYLPGESPEQGRKRTAAKLAQAEQEATARGWRVEWSEDPDGWDSLGDIDPDDVKEILQAVLYDGDGNVLASLGGIVNPGRNYGRVIEAELALEALPSSTRGAAEPRRANMARAPRARARVQAPSPRLDSFTRAYLNTALWSSTDESDDSGGEPLDKNYDVSDIADGTRAKMIADCADFQERFADLLAAAPIDSERAGRNFWLSRNGHGAGFFDDNLDDLQDAAETYGTFNLYIGDDGEIHGS